MKPRLLYVVTEDWAFLLHRLPMARAARAAGYEVHVATNVTDGAAALVLYATYSPQVSEQLLSLPVSG